MEVCFCCCRSSIQGLGSRQFLLVYIVLLSSNHHSLIIKSVEIVFRPYILFLNNCFVASTTEKRSCKAVSYFPSISVDSSIASSTMIDNQDV